MFGHGIRKKYITWFGIWHLLQGIVLWTIWIEHTNKVFNQKQWHELKVKNLIWEECIIYGKAAWVKTLKHIERSPLAKAFITGELTRLEGGARSYVVTMDSRFDGRGRSWASSRLGLGGWVGWVVIP